jgi:hypothetical protein
MPKQTEEPGPQGQEPGPRGQEPGPRGQEPGPRGQEPGPGRSTSEAAFNDLRKEIAARNERTHQEARKARAAREREKVLRRRVLDAL